MKKRESGVAKLPDREEQGGSRSPAKKTKKRSDNAITRVRSFQEKKSRKRKKKKKHGEPEAGGTLRARRRIFTTK